MSVSINCGNLKKNPEKKEKSRVELGCFLLMRKRLMFLLDGSYKGQDTHFPVGCTAPW